LAHAHGVAVDPSVRRGAEVDELQDLVDSSVRDAAGSSQDTQRVSATSSRVEDVGVEECADDSRGVAELGVTTSLDQRPAGRRPGDAQQHPQRRRLAGAVGADEAGDGPGLKGKAEVVNGAHRAVALGESVDRDGGHGFPFIGRSCLMSMLVTTAAHRVRRTDALGLLLRCPSVLLEEYSGVFPRVRTKLACVGDDRPAMHVTRSRGGR